MIRNRILKSIPIISQCQFTNMLANIYNIGETFEAETKQGRLEFELRAKG